MRRAAGSRALVATATLALATTAGCGARVGPFPATAGHSVGKAATTSTSSTTTVTIASGTGTSGSRSTPQKAAPGSPSGAGSSGGATGPKPAAPGTYHYNQSGSFSASGSTQNDPPQGTVVVDQATSTGANSWQQVFHSYIDTSQPPTDTTFVINPSGISVVSEVIRQSSVTVSCTFAQPVQVIDWPPTVGHQFSGSSTCGGQFNLTVNGAITGTQSTTIDGAALTAYAVTTNISTSGNLSSSGVEHDWFDPAAEVDVHQDSSQSGTYGFFKFTSQVTRTLVSAHPS
jgi:hypothetical protein